MISVIIPTLNEENYLPFLLESIKKQNFHDIEVIIVDGGSKDKTIGIAQKYNCKITEGGSPAKGRNEGAKIAQGNLLLFLDADTLLPDSFFERALKEFRARDLDVAAFCLEPPERFQKFLFNIFYNWPILLLEKIFSHASQAILVKREIFEKIGGFDEKIKFAEDHNFVKRTRKYGRFGILKTVRILSSPRRFEKDGWVKTYFKYIFAEFYMLLVGDIKKKFFKYEFGNFDRKL